MAAVISCASSSLDQRLVVALSRMQRRRDGRVAQAAERDRRGRFADRALALLQRGRVGARGGGDQHERAHARRREDAARQRRHHVVPQGFVGHEAGDKKESHPGILADACRLAIPATAVITLKSVSPVRDIGIGI
jgi:hypothetical protein